MPGTTVLAVSNLGAPILVYSGHRVFAGPYHRNVAGNLLALDAFLGSDGKRLRSFAIITSASSPFVAVNPESQLLASPRLKVFWPA